MTAELVVIKAEDQTRRQMCEDCRHSRGDGSLLRCSLRYDQPCKLSRALRAAEADCPRGDEYAVIWKAARLDEPEVGCGEPRESYAEQVARLKAIRSETSVHGAGRSQVPADHADGQNERGLHPSPIRVYESTPATCESRRRGVDRAAVPGESAAEKI